MSSFLSFSSIIGLLFGCGPTAVVRLIVAVIVRISINGMLSGGSSSHVSKECFIGFCPSCADCNSAGSIAEIILPLRTIASVFDSTPSSIFLGSIVRSFNVTLAVAFSRKAAAAFSVSSQALQVSSANCLNGSTFAPTNPKAPFNSWITMQNSQAGENLPGKVYTLWHGRVASFAIRSWRRVLAHPSPLSFYPEAYSA